MRTFTPKRDQFDSQASSRAARPGRASMPTSVRDILGSSGQPLDETTRSFMEPRFGHDFSQVRIHSAAGAAASAAAVHAQAYTVGQHIVLGSGSPSPQSQAGRLLLAHELAHVVQQSGGVGTEPVPEISPTAPHEAEARAAAMAVVAGQTGVKVASRTGVGLARQERQLEGVLLVARDLVEQELGLLPQRVADLEDALRIIGESGTGHAESARGLLRELNDELLLPDRHRNLREVQEAAGEFLRQNRPWPGVNARRGRRLTTIVEELQRAAAGSGPEAARARTFLDQIERLRGRVGELETARRATEARFQAPTNVEPRIKAAPKIEPKVPTQASAGVKSPPTGAAAGAKVESTVVHAAEAASVEVKAATRLSRVGSGLAKIGSLGFNLLLPGPLDALALMVQFAGSYAAAQEAIRSRNTRTGFAIGLSAFLLGRSHEAVRKHLTRRFVLDREVHTQVVGAVGIAENAHNSGLDSGFNYGALLSDDAKDALRDFGFSALAAQGRLPERSELFAAEGVWRLAGAILPAVDQIFEAMRAAAERQREEERRKRRLESGYHGMKF
jgi:hypothetical protein